MCAGFLPPAARLLMPLYAFRAHRTRLSMTRNSLAHRSADTSDSVKGLRSNSNLRRNRGRPARLHNTRRQSLRESSNCTACTIPLSWLMFFEFIAVTLNILTISVDADSMIMAAFA